MTQKFVMLLLLLILLAVGIGFGVVLRGTPTAQSKAGAPAGNTATGGADARPAEGESRGTTTVMFLAPCTQPCRQAPAYHLEEVELEGCTEPCYQLHPVAPEDCTRPCYRLVDACSGDCEYKVTINAPAADWRDALETGQTGSEYSIEPCKQPCSP